MPAPHPAVCHPSRTAHFDIGRDRDGHWIAVARQGHCGGLFRTIDDALQFVRRQAGRIHQPAVTFTTEQLDLLPAPAGPDRPCAQR